MLKLKLQVKYGSHVKFVGVQRRSDIILLNNTSTILTEDWYKEKKSNFADDTERIIKTAAKLIKSFEDITEYYPGVEDIKNKSNSFIPSLLKTFVSELTKNPLKQIS